MGLKIAVFIVAIDARHHLPMVMVDRNYIVRMINPASKNYYQVEFQEMVDQPCELSLPGVSPSDRVDVRSVIQEGKNVTFERRSPLDSRRFE